MSILYSCSHGNDKPNVVIIYSDDIGYGDIGVYGAGLIPTPNIDKLASEGIRFTDGHCAASTCSPSRYALLTGEMGFRKNAGIQPVNAPATIQPTQFTLGKLFQNAGYKTGIIGKWHLGLGNGDINWNKEIKPGPLEVGFDYCFIIPSSNDRSPFVYVENHRVYNDDPNDPITVSRDRIPDSIPGTKYPDAILNNDPFFLLLTTNDIHAPRLPHPRFKGVTDLGYRGGKYQIYEGGTRVPFIIRWPPVIKPRVSEALVSQVDLMASFADFLEMEIPENAAPDSRNYWNTFIGKDEKRADVILEQTNTQNGLAIRKGIMKYINLQNKNYELYNLDFDPGEENNIIKAQPELAEELHQDLMKLREVHLNTYSKRTQYFPKAEIKVESIPDNKNRVKINEQIRAYVSTDSNAAVVETSDLKDKGDKIHFNSDGQRVLGQRFADQYIRSQKLPTHNNENGSLGGK